MGKAATSSSLGHAHWRRAAGAVVEYGLARKRLRDAQELMRPLLDGNDNKVGVAGEFWAKYFCAQRGWQIEGTEPSNREAFDFVVRRGRSRLRVSVKVVSKESRLGRQLRLKESLDWDELVLILLDEWMIPYLLGRASRRQFEEAQARGAIGKTPFVSRGWLGAKGWMSVYANAQAVAPKSLSRVLGGALLQKLLARDAGGVSSK